MRFALLLLVWTTFLTPTPDRGPIRAPTFLTFEGPSLWPLNSTSVALNVYATIPFESVGLSYWLQTEARVADYIYIYAPEYFTFTDPNQTGIIFFNSPYGADSRYRRTSHDLGATVVDILEPIPPATHWITRLRFFVSGRAPVGNYSLRLTTAYPARSGVIANSPPLFDRETDLPPAQFNFSVVPALAPTTP